MLALRSRDEDLAGVADQPGLNGEGIYVILNSDAGRVRSVGPGAMRLMVRRAGPGDVAKIVTTDRHDLRATLLEAAKSKPRAIAIAGGDDTAHAALEVLTPLGIPTAPLPGGTMNRLSARVFGRASFAQCLAALDAGAARPLSGGRVGDATFYVAAGFGGWMHLQTLRERLRKPKSIEGLRAVLRMAPHQFEDRVTWSVRDGQSLSHTSLLVGVGRINSAFGLGLERHEPLAFEAAGAEIRDWGALALLTGAVAVKHWRKLKQVTTLSTRSLTLESNHEGTPALFDGEFRMLPRRNTVTFDPTCGLVWVPHRRRAPW